MKTEATKTKENALSIPLFTTGTSNIAWTLSLTLLAIIAPALLAHAPQNQLLTGTIVNALLFFSAWKVGVTNTIFVAVLPSSIALIRGLLPAPMALMIPYIIISNILLVVLFAWFRKKPVLGVLSSSLAKFSFLGGISFLMSSQLNSTLLYMLTWPQLITALLGGFISLTLIKKLQN